MISRIPLGLMVGLCVALAAESVADTVFLKNGTKLEGRVVRKPGFVEVHTSVDVVKISEAMIERIESDAAATRNPLATRRGRNAAALWRAKYAETLRRKVDLDFADTPASDALEFLRDWSGLNILLSPEATEVAREHNITLRVNSMEFKMALQWILKLSRLHMTVKDHALYITDRPCPEYDLRGYDVRDLLVSIRDQEVRTAGGGGSGGGLSGLGGEGDEDEYDMPQRASDLMRLIVTIIEPTSWGYAFISGGGEDQDFSLGDFF